MNGALSKGNLAVEKANHIVDLGDGFIIIKNVPANSCNQCGEYYLNTKTAIKLEEIVDELKKNKAEVLIINFSS